jgi:hypothetical protein
MPPSVVMMPWCASWPGRVAPSLLTALVATALWCEASRANPPLISASQRTWGFEISGGLNSYRLSAFNDSLGSLNRDLGTTFESIRRGSDFGAALRCWVNPRVLLRLHAERHAAVSNSSDIRDDIGPWAIGLGATYFTRPEIRIRCGVGVAAGYVGIHGRFEGPRFDFDTGGSGLDLRATGEAMWPLGGGWFVNGSAGLRYARVSEVELEKQGIDTAADFSGVTLRIALGRDQAFREARTRGGSGRSQPP